MLSKRLIACLDVRNGCVVKGVNFEALREAGDPAALARRYNAEGIDEVVVLDVTATIEGRRAFEATIRAVSSELFIPLTVGGGIRTEADAAAALDAGADKVGVNSAALADPALLTRLAARYGSQAVVVAIDAKRSDGRFDVFARSGSASTGRDAVEWAIEAESRGAGEVLLTSIDRDGTRAGFDCELDRRRVGGRLDSRDRVGRRRHLRSLHRGLHRRTRGRRAGGVRLPLLRARGRRPEAAPARQGDSRPMLIPSIDLQGGKIVQLVQGERLAIETDDIDAWVTRFSGRPKVQLIDLDAAKGAGEQRRARRAHLRGAALPGRRRHPQHRARRGDPRARRDEGDPRLGAVPRRDRGRGLRRAPERPDRPGSPDRRGRRPRGQGRRPRLAHDARPDAGRGHRAARAVLRRVSLHPRGPRRAHARDRHGRHRGAPGRHRPGAHRRRRDHDAGGNRRSSTRWGSTRSSGWRSIRGSWNWTEARLGSYPGFQVRNRDLRSRNRSRG